MIQSFEEHRPDVADDVFVADDARVIGRVRIGAGSSVWFGAILRGDGENIEVGRRTNLQDRVVVHVATDHLPTRVGNDVTVGHGAILHACTVGDRALIGIGAILLDGSRVDPESMVAAGAVVPPGFHVPSRTLAVGAPARIARDLRPAEIEHLERSADRYVRLAMRYRDLRGQ